MSLDISQIEREVRGCARCGLRQTCKLPVPGNGNIRGSIFGVAEAPGRVEDNTNKPLQGQSGMEYNMYLSSVGLTRGNTYTTNAAKCRPPDNRDPEPDELASCNRHLRNELSLTTAPVILCIGKHGYQAVTGRKCEMEKVHGIPEYYTIPETGRRTILLPIFHPAYGIHSPSKMGSIFSDFQTLAKLIRGQAKPEDWQDRHPKPEYAVVDRLGLISYLIRDNQGTFGIDTEVRGDWVTPYSVQISHTPGTGVMIMATDLDAVDFFREFVNSNPEILWAYHNFKFDFRVLRRMGIRTKRNVDCMVAAYQVQQPQGLKTLGFRLSGVKMESFTSLVHDLTWFRYYNYFSEAVKVDWPKPPKQIKLTEEGEKNYQPQSMTTKLKRALTDLNKPGGIEIDVVERWANWSEEEKADIITMFGELNPCDLSDVKPEIATEYGCRDADVTLRSWLVLEQQLHEYGLYDVFQVDMDVLPMLIEMEDVGFAADRNALAELSAYYKGEMAKLQTEIDLVAGHYVNLGSPKQVSDFLYKKLGIKVPFYTKKDNPSTDEEALKTVQDKHPVIPKMIKWRGLEKNRSGFADALPKKIRRGRIHSDLQNTRTITGRLASKNPNLMNIPARSEEGKKIRKCFMAAPGCTLVSADYSQIEMRLLAHEAQDKEMMNIFLKGLDIHTQTASRIFGVPYEAFKTNKDYKDKYRTPAKTLGFGIVYGLTAEGLLDQLLLEGLKWTLAECRNLIKEWLGVFPGIDQYFKRVRSQARRFGYVTDMFGKRYYVHNIKSSIDYIVSEAERQCGNYPIQGGAQGIIKRGMIQMDGVYPSFREMGYTVNPIMQIHDDLIWEVSDEIVDAFAPVFCDTMESAVKLSIPLKVEAKTGKVWGDLEVYKAA